MYCPSKVRQDNQATEVQVPSIGDLLTPCTSGPYLLALVQALGKGMKDCMKDCHVLTPCRRGRRSDFLDVFRRAPARWITSCARAMGHVRIAYSPPVDGHSAYLCRRILRPRRCYWSAGCALSLAGEPRKRYEA